MANYYVDLELETNPGYVANDPNNPVGYTEFKTLLAAASHTFYMKGKREDASADLTVPQNTVFQPWDALTNGPWRWKLTGLYNGDFGYQVYNGGILELSGTFRIRWGNIHIRNMFIRTGIFQDRYHISSSTVEISGSTVIANEFRYETEGMTYNIKDSIMVTPTITHDPANGYVGTMNISNTVCSNAAFGTMSQVTYATNTNNQFGWTAPTFPSWDAAKEEFEYSRMLAGVNSGILAGTSPYTNYSTDLFGNPRTKIAAVYIENNGAPITISLQPQSTSIILGSSKTLTIAASGVLDIAYQWYKDGQELAGATNTSVSVSLGGEYYCRAYDRDDTNNYTDSDIAVITQTADIYCDFSNANAGSIGHAGTQDDPFGADDFASFPKYSGQIYHIKGRNTNFPFSTQWQTGENAITLKPWDIDTNGPWGFSSGSKYKLDRFIIENAILSIKGITAPMYNATFRSCAITFTTIVGGQLTGAYALFEGCFINFVNPVQATNAHLIFKDCLIVGNGLQTTNSASISFINCAVNRSVSDWNKAASFTQTNTQWNCSIPAMPTILDPKETWASKTFLANVQTPPMPGSIPFTGYEKGLWGSPRTGIGALHFPYPSSKLSAGTSIAVTTEVNTVSEVSAETIAAYDKVIADTNFSNPNNWTMVSVVYKHSGGQKVIIPHRKVDGKWVGTVKLGAYNSTGTWQKEALVVTEKGGDVIVIERSDIGQFEDLTLTA